MRKKIGILFMSIGAVLLIAALSLFLYNQIEDKNAGKSAEEILPAVITAMEEPNGDAVNDADTDMTVTEIDGYGYIGYLSVPALDLDLPVMSEWDYTRLKIAPCRYYGSTKTDDLVICGHNYTRHFRKLKNLRAGDYVLFTDMDDVTTAYKVKEVETLQSTQISQMIQNDYDLTLYTCTYDGQARVTVRCDRASAGS